MLNPLIVVELFNVAYALNIVIIEQICDELVKYGYYVTNVVNNDVTVVIVFKAINLNCGIKGELQIDRINKVFIIAVENGDAVVMPVVGGWELIDEYLRKTHFSL